MDELILDIEGRFQIPKKYRNQKRLTIKQPYVCRIIQGRSERWYMRHKPEKPYTEQDTVIFDKEKYKIVAPDYAQILVSMFKCG